MASGKVNDQDITVSSEENVTSKTEVNLSVEYLSFTVKSNLKDGDLYVGGTKIGTLNSGKLDVNKVAVAGSSAVYVKMIALSRQRHCLLRKFLKVKRLL